MHEPGYRQILALKDHVIMILLDVVAKPVKHYKQIHAINVMVF